LDHFILDVDHQTQIKQQYCPITTSCWWNCNENAWKKKTCSSRI